MPSPIKLLPVLIIVSVLSFSVRLSEVITGFSNMSVKAHAEIPPFEVPFQEEVQIQNIEPAAGKKEDKKKGKQKDEELEEVAGTEANAPKWRDPGNEIADIDGVKLELFEELSERRKVIERAEKDLKIREALIKAAEQEVDQKVTELTSLRQEIENLIGVKNQEDQKRIERLVKIYEGMKPTNAANVFNTLDLDVLISVISRMSERKVSPILSAMNPERARTVTTMLAGESQLPSLQ